MSLIEWKPDFEIGIEEIDAQHKILVDMINELYDAILSGKGLEKMDDILTGLFFYSEKHFDTEEEYFRKYSYPDSEEHIRQHHDFIKKISNQFERVRKGEVVLSVEITKYLRDWLLNHVLGSDKKYREYFLYKGIM